MDLPLATLKASRNTLRTVKPKNSRPWNRCRPGLLLVGMICTGEPLCAPQGICARTRAEIKRRAHNVYPADDDNSTTLSPELSIARAEDEAIRSARSKKMLPHTAAAPEATRIPIFDISRKVPLLNARLAMNNDMVKPIPHIQLAPKTWRQETSVGGVAKLSLAESQATVKMPKGFPINNPRVTPKLTGCLTAATTFPRTRTPAFANAKRGITKKLTQGCKRCSIRCSGDSNSSHCISRV
jgi:hypothetical protein